MSVTKKSLFEKLGLIEPVDGAPNAEEVIEQPDQKEFDLVESIEANTPIVKEEPKDNNIEDKLDALIENYEKNKLQSIDEIYRNSNLESDSKKTIFMADILLKALPENLPIDIKQKSVLNIMDASNIRPDELLNDAYIRIDALNTVLEETVTKSEDIVHKNNDTISELKKRIEELEKINNDRKAFEENQNTLIEYEIQKVISIVEVIKSKR